MRPITAPARRCTPGPEDNGIEIYRDRPRAEWPRDEDGRVELYTEPLDLDALAADAGGGKGLPVGTDLGHVHLEVTSLEAFGDRYVDTLGFEVHTRWPDAWFVAAGGYHHHLAANTWNQRTAPTRGRGLAWFEVLLPDEASFEAVRDRLERSEYAIVETETGIAVTDADEITVRIRVDS